MSFLHLKAAAKRLLEGKPEDLAFNLDYLRTALDTCDSKLFQGEIQEAVEQAWLKRAKSLGYTKPYTTSYRRKEIEFFCGAMAALHEVLPDSGDDRLGSLVPVSWVLEMMAGNNIVEPPK